MQGSLLSGVTEHNLDNPAARTLMRGHLSFATLGVLELLPKDVFVILFIGPDGRQTKLTRLPRRDLKNWQPRHKAMVVAAVRHGLISIDEACIRYNLSVERYLCWYRCYAPQPPEDGK